jgi:hypothetical protein
MAVSMISNPFLQLSQGIDKWNDVEFFRYVIPG